MVLDVRACWKCSISMAYPVAIFFSVFLYDFMRISIAFCESVCIASPLASMVRSMAARMTATSPLVGNGSWSGTFLQLRCCGVPEPSCGGRA